MAGTARQERTTWVAIRLEARLLAQTGDDDADSSSRAPYRLLRLARRMPRILESEGLSGRLLDADELLDALQRCCDLLPAAAPVAPRERWTGWSSTNLVHVTYWISRWPATGTEQDLLDELTYVPNAMTAVTLRIFAADERPGADGSAEFAAEVFDLRGLVRVAASADRIEVACTQVARAAQAHGALLRRLDGEHAPAVYATAPTGGGVR
jgi:type VII secretion protein EccE